MRGENRIQLLVSIWLDRPVVCHSTNLSFIKHLFERYRKARYRDYTGR